MAACVDATLKQLQLSASWRMPKLLRHFPEQTQDGAVSASSPAHAILPTGTQTTTVRVMALFGNGVEYGLHCLLWLTHSRDQEVAASSRDLADLQGISATFVAKVFPRLEKAGIVTASEGLRGGYRLARAADRISVLDVVGAIEGNKPLFECQQIRERCALFQAGGAQPPAWATEGVCSIHAVMLRAERAMRDELARTTLADLSQTVTSKAPDGFDAQAQAWLSTRFDNRRGSPQLDFPRRGVRSWSGPLASPLRKGRL